MSKSISQQEQSLHAQIDQADEKLVTLENRLRALDDELASHLSQRPQYQLLEDVCASLSKLGNTSAADLYLGATGGDPGKQLQQLSGAVAGYQQKISTLEQSRPVLLSDIEKERDSARLLNKHLEELQAQLESESEGATVEHPAREIPFRTSALPWSKHGTDERFYHRLLYTILFLTVVFGALVPVLKPPVETTAGIVVPQRIAQLIKKKEEAKRVEQKPQEKVAEKKEEKIEEKADKPKPTDADTLKARKRAETKGVLALKNSFADLMKESAPLKLGADARISNKSAQASASGPAQRSIIVSQATSGSGGINTSALNRQSEGAGGQRIAGISFERIEAGVATGGGEIQPGKKGQPARTDEEIQLVFDRYKSALYRIYNRELRSNPTLRGKMVLRIVIEPDGRVSACSVKSSDLASPALSTDIVDRVLKFNFGPKEGVTAITILYPIDFLPAS